MKTNMTSRERILATVAGQPTDHVPLSMEVHPSYLLYDPKVAHWRDQFERTDDLLALGTDPMVEIWLPDPCYHPDVKVTSWRENNQSDGMSRLCKAYETPKGTLRQVIRETSDLYQWHKINRNTRAPLADLIDGVGLVEDVNPSRSVEFLINGPEDLDKMEYLFLPPSGDALAKWREDAMYAKGEAEKRKTMLLARRLYGGSAMLWLTNAQKTMCTFAEDPDYIRRFLDIIHRWQMKLLEMVLEIGVDMVTRFGYYDTPDFWGVKYFDQFLRPLMDREAEVCEQVGTLLSQQQSEGLCIHREIYKRMKVHVLRDVDPVQGGEDMALLKRELGATKTLMGGMNCDIFLAGANRESVDAAVKRTIELMSPGGRFILHPIPGVYAGVPWDKVLWMVDSWRRYA
jgi:uroporphyrinogen-III decarboxylase